MPRKIFVAGEILTAADVNTNLMDQAVMVFDDDAARTTAIPTPVEGMVTYLKDTDVLEKFTGSAFVDVNTDSGKILQVVSTTKTDTFTTASSSFTDITNFSVSITPFSATSKILISGFVSGANTIDLNTSLFQLVRDSTAIALGDASESRSRVTFEITRSDQFAAQSASFNFLDSPNTTGALTYKVQIRNNGSATVFVNRSQNDANSAFRGRSVSTITVMEVAG